MTSSTATRGGRRRQINVDFWLFVIRHASFSVLYSLPLMVLIEEAWRANR